MKKKMSFILVLVLVMTIVSIPANAASNSPVARIGNTTYATLQDAIDTATGSKLAPVTITMINDTIEAVSVQNKQYIRLDLNGHTIDGNGAERVIYNNGDLIITDTSEQSDGKITGGSARTGYGGGVYNRKTLTLEAGTITACTAKNGGGGVYNDSSGTFLMKGGSIESCFSEYSGGGIYNSHDLCMLGGTIRNCTSEKMGGGITNQTMFGSSVEFIMEDGLIADCVSSNGGGVYNNTNCVFRMEGGSIANCSVTMLDDYPDLSGRGGGVYNYGGQITMNGGEISDCVSAVNGSSIYINGGAIDMSDGMVAFDIVNDAGTVVITGGAFGQDVSAWVAEGYQCVTNASDYPYSVCPVGNQPDPGDDPPDPGEDPPNPDADVTFSMDQVSGKPGDTVYVGLYVDSKVDINTIGLNLTSYSSDIMTFAGFVNPGEIISNSMTGAAGMDSEKAVISIGYMQAAQYSGKICDLKFVIREDAQDAEATIRMNAVAKKGSNVFSTYVQSGTVSIKNYILGDLNGDENVDIDDAVALLQYSIFPEFYPLNYSGNVDFNHDGNIDIDDAVLLLQYSIFPEFYPIS